MAAKKLDAVIIGAGPSGLAAAHALSKVLPRGSRIALYERAPAVTIPRGAGLQLEINGLQALKAIDEGVYNALMEKHAVIKHSLEFREPKGTVLRTTENGPSYAAQKEKFGMHAMDMGWHELVTTMAEMLPPGVEVHTDTKLVSYEETEEGVKVLFEGKEQETVTADLLVAADGYFSRARQLCLNDGPPDFGGAMVWRARVEAEQAEKFGYQRGRVVWYFGGNRVLLIFTISRGNVVWTASCPEPLLEEAGIDWRAVTERRQDASAQSSDYLQRSRENGEAAKERLLRVFADFEKPVLDLMMDTDPVAIVEHAIYVRPAADLTPSWFGKGRVVLLGDAAHPMRPTGQGTNQALEDVYQLASYIAQDGGGLGKLDDFREYRAKRLQPIMAMTEQLGKASYRTDAKSGSSGMMSNGNSSGGGGSVAPAAAPAAPSIPVITDYAAYMYGEGFEALVQLADVAAPESAFIV